MPPLGLLLGGIDFSSFALVLKEATEKNPAITLQYGSFLNTVIDFLIVAFAIFMVIKGMNSLKKKEEEKPAALPKPAEDILLLSEIRDLLKE